MGALGARDRNVRFKRRQESGEYSGNGSWIEWMTTAVDLGHTPGYPKFFWQTHMSHVCTQPKQIHIHFIYLFIHPFIHLFTYIYGDCVIIYNMYKLYII